MDGICLNDRGRFMSIPVMKFVLNNNITELKKLIQNCPDIVNFIHKKSGDTPILVAARYKRSDVLKLLHESGGDIEHKNSDGKKALHEAALSGCINSVNYILQHKVNVDALKRADWTPLMIASTQGHLDVIKSLVEFHANITRVNKDGWNCFHLACREGFIPLLNYFLDINSSIWDTCSKNLRTPLHTAAMHGQLDTVKFLLKNCCYTKDEKDSCGSTALMDSFRFGFVDIADVLIKEHGANIFECDALGRYCLHIASHSGQLNSLEYLVETCHVDANLPCLNSTTTALHLAAKEGHVDVLKYIISVGGAVSSVDKNNRTALHLATAANKLEVVKLLLDDYNVDTSIPDACGRTALQYALTDDVRLCFQ